MSRRWFPFPYWLLATGAIVALSGWAQGPRGVRTGLPDGAATRAQVLQGRYLVTAVSACSDCHSPKPAMEPGDAGWLSGSTESFSVGPWKSRGPNLTPDKATGLGRWTSREIFNALKDGKDREGHSLCPPMPSANYYNMTDDDLWAMVAYLQSVKPVRNQVPEPQGPPAPDADRPMPAFPAVSETPSADPQVLRGRYLVTAAACGECHSPTAKPTDPFGPANPKWMSGSDRPFTVGEWTTYAPNLTPDKTTGLGEWSARQIRRALQTGQDDEGRMLCPPMPSAAVYHNLTADDALAIAAYLQGLKPVSNAVPKPKGPPCPKTVPTLPPYPAAQEVNVP